MQDNFLLDYCCRMHHSQLVVLLNPSRGTPFVVAFKMALKVTSTFMMHSRHPLISFKFRDPFKCVSFNWDFNLRTLLNVSGSMGIS